MIRPLFRSIPVLALLATCASTPAFAAAQGPAAQGTPSEAASASKQKAAEAMLEFWREPEFQRRFVESFLRDSEVEPPMTAREVELMEEVLGLMDEKEVDKAMSRLRSRQGEGTSATIDFTLAGLHFQREELEDANREYEVAVAKYPKFRRAWKNLALVRMRLGRYPEAAEAFVRVLNLGGGDALTYGLLAFAHSNAEDHLAAETAYRMAAMLEPSRIDWRLGLARSFFKQRRYGEAATLCGAMIDRNPDRGDLWLLQANAYVGMSETAKAAENLEFVDRLGAATFESLFLLGDIYVNDRLYDLAAKAYARAIEKDTKADHRRALRAANQLAVRSAYPESRELAERIEAVYRDSLDAVAKKDLLKLRARLALASGAGDEEARILEQVVALDPLDGDALILLGQYHARQGEPEKAILRYQQAAELEAFAARAKVRHAQLLAGEGRYAEALPLLRAAQKLDPQEYVQKFLEDVERAAGRSQ